MEIVPASGFHGALGLIVLAGLLTGSSGQAQTYALNSAALSGGGGISSGGGFTVSATIGQLDANPSALTGGRFSLLGGFWSLFAVQTPGHPSWISVAAFHFRP